MPKGFNKNTGKGNLYNHGMTGTRIYNIWKHIRQRCNNPKCVDYPRYGGRGISISKDWESFENFYEWAMASGYREDLSIDRNNNDKDYCPSNCSWETQKKQQRNRSNSKSWFVNGVKYESAQEASEDLGVTKSSIQNWCEGRTTTRKDGTKYFTPPKPDCYSELKYG